MLRTSTAESPAYGNQKFLKLHVEFDETCQKHPRKQRPIKDGKAIPDKKRPDSGLMPKKRSQDTQGPKEYNFKRNRDIANIQILSRLSSLPKSTYFCQNGPASEYNTATSQPPFADHERHQANKTFGAKFSDSAWNVSRSGKTQISDEKTPIKARSPKRQHSPSPKIKRYLQSSPKRSKNLRQTIQQVKTEIKIASNVNETPLFHTKFYSKPQTHQNKRKIYETSFKLPIDAFFINGTLNCAQKIQVKTTQNSPKRVKRQMGQSQKVPWHKQPLNQNLMNVNFMNDDLNSQVSPPRKKNKFSALPSISGASRTNARQGMQQAQSSNAKMLQLQRMMRKSYSSHSLRMSRKDLIDKFFSRNSNLNTMAAERYTKGPITQVIKALDDNTRILITQITDKKSKKPEILMKQIMPSRKPYDTNSLQSTYILPRKPRPVSQPDISTIDSQKILTTLSETFAVDKLATKQSTVDLLSNQESKFTQEVRTKVNRETSLIQNQDSAIDDSCRSLMVKEYIGSIFDDALVEEDAKLRLQKEEIPQKQTKAAIIIQSYLRCFKARQFVKKQKILKQIDKQSDKQKNEKPPLWSIKPLEIDEDYKDEEFDVQSGAGEKSDVSDAVINTASSFVEKQPLNSDDQFEKESIQDEVDSKTSERQSKFNHDQTKSAATSLDGASLEPLKIQKIASSSTSKSQDKLEQRANYIFRHSTFYESGNFAGQLQGSPIQAIQRNVITSDEYTQTSAFFPQPKTNGYSQRMRPILSQMSTQTDDFNILKAQEPFAAKEKLSKVLRFPQISVEFLKIDEKEEVLRKLHMRPGPVKVQAVLLPFQSDQMGVKIGFKAIMQNTPNFFQNELIHIDLELKAEDLRSDESKVTELIEALHIDQTTGNLTMPPKNVHRIALFTIMVEDRDGVASEREVIAVYENFANPTELSDGKVVLQTMTASKNKLTIPIKKHKKKVCLEDLKANLLERLPRIVYVDRSGHVALSVNEKQRIGRVLPSGQGTREQSPESSKLYQDPSRYSDTFISHLDRVNQNSDPISPSNKSNRTRLVKKYRQLSNDFREDFTETWLQKFEEKSIKYVVDTNMSEADVKSVKESKIFRFEPIQSIIENEINNASQKPVEVKLQTEEHQSEANKTQIIQIKEHELICDSSSDAIFSTPQQVRSQQPNSKKASLVIIKKSSQFKPKFKSYFQMNSDEVEVSSIDQLRITSQSEIQDVHTQKAVHQFDKDVDWTLPYNIKVSSSSVSRREAENDKLELHSFEQSQTDKQKAAVQSISARERSGKEFSPIKEVRNDSSLVSYLRDISEEQDDISQTKSPKVVGQNFQRTFLVQRIESQRGILKLSPKKWPMSQEKLVEADYETARVPVNEGIVQSDFDRISLKSVTFNLPVQAIEKKKIRVRTAQTQKCPFQISDLQKDSDVSSIPQIHDKVDFTIKKVPLMSVQTKATAEANQYGMDLGQESHVSSIYVSPTSPKEPERDVMINLSLEAQTQENFAEGHFACDKQSENHAEPFFQRVLDFELNSLSNLEGTSSQNFIPITVSPTKSLNHLPPLVGNQLEGAFDESLRKQEFLSMHQSMSERLANMERESTQRASEEFGENQTHRILPQQGLIELADCVSSKREEEPKQLSEKKPKKVEVEFVTPRIVFKNNQIGHSQSVSSLNDAHMQITLTPSPLPTPKAEVVAMTQRMVAEFNHFKHDLDVSSFKDNCSPPQSPQQLLQKEKAELQTQRLPLNAYLELESNISSLVDLKAIEIIPEPQMVENRVEAPTQRANKIGIIEQCSDSDFSNVRKPPRSSGADKIQHNKKKTKTTTISQRTHSGVLHRHSFDMSSQEDKARFISESVHRATVNSDQKSGKTSFNLPKLKSLSVLSLQVNLVESCPVSFSNEDKDSQKQEVNPIKKKVGKSSEILSSVTVQAAEQVKIAKDDVTPMIEEGFFSPHSQKQMIKIKPSQVKSVRTKKNTRGSDKRLPSTNRAQNSSHLMEEVPSELTEVLAREDEVQSQEVRDQKSLIETDTVRDVVIERGIPRLYFKQGQFDQTQTRGEIQATIKPYPIVPTLVNKSEESSRMYKDFTTIHMFNGEFWKNIDKDLDDNVQKSDDPKSSSRKKSPIASSITTVNDWRAGVQIKFEVTSKNSSAIQLYQDGIVVDTKNIPVNLFKIAKNYDVASMDQFCNKWLMPCISIKSPEWQSLVQDINKEQPLKPLLQLYVSGEMLSELIFRQYMIQESQRTNGLNQQMNFDLDDARDYTHEPSLDQSAHQKSQSHSSLQVVEDTYHHKYEFAPLVSDSSTKDADLALEQTKIPRLRYQSSQNETNGVGSEQQISMTNPKSNTIETRELVDLNGAGSDQPFSSSNPKSITNASNKPTDSDLVISVIDSKNANSLD